MESATSQQKTPTCRPSLSTRIPVSVDWSTASHRPTLTPRTRSSSVGRPSVTKATTRADSVQADEQARTHSPTLERRMDDSVETLLRQWDAGLRSRTETSVAVRPAVPPTPVKDRRQRLSRLEHRDEDEEASRSTSKELGRAATGSNLAVECLRREETLNETKLNGVGGYSSGDDSFDDYSATTRSLPETQVVDGRHTGAFHVEFDADGYDPSDVTARVDAGRLVVHGVRQQTDGGRRSTIEFCRKIRLPEDVDATRLACRMVDGRVVIDGPRQCRPSVAAAAAAVTSGSSTRISHGNWSSTDPLNVPLVTGDELRLAVEVGRVFRADDVVVKVKNSTSTLTVSADRNEHPATGGGRLSASLTWQFDLSAPVDVETLRAGLTVDGLLRITARLQSDTDGQRPVSVVTE